MCVTNARPRRPENAARTPVRGGLGVRADRLGHLVRERTPHFPGASAVCGVRTGWRSLPRPRASSAIHDSYGPGTTNGAAHIAVPNRTRGTSRLRGSKRAAATLRWRPRTSIRCTCARAHRTCSNCTAVCAQRAARNAVRAANSTTSCRSMRSTTHAAAAGGPTSSGSVSPCRRQVWDRAQAAAQRADVMLVIGTSGLVNPAAALCTRFAAQAFIVEVNPEPTAITPSCHAALRGTAARVLPELLGDARQAQPPALAEVSEVRYSVRVRSPWTTWSF